MKNFILILTLLVSIVASAQDEPLTYSEVIKVEGKKQAQIFGELREWVAIYYPNGKAVTQMEDSATGTIILKDSFPFRKGGIYSSYNGNVDYILKLRAKDGRYRVEMSQIIHSVKNGNYESELGLITTADDCGCEELEKGANNKICKEIKEKASEEFNDLTMMLKCFNRFNAEEDEW